MSAGKDQEYFSDGLSEELLNLLSKISELKVIGRTSSFSFKGKNEDFELSVINLVVIFGRKCKKMGINSCYSTTDKNHGGIYGVKNMTGLEGILNKTR
jgi:hypothetical protein